MADYLKIVKSPKHRSALTKIRLSAHKYPIETGRYRKMKREERECPLCCKSIGDEKHYILECSHPFFTKIRVPIITELLNINPLLESMDIEERFKYLIDSKDDVTIQLVSKLCFKVQEMFQDITY